MTTRLIPGLLSGLFMALIGGRALPAAEEWEVVLQQTLNAEHSQTRQDGLKQVNVSTTKGLRALWKVLAMRDPARIDWYVREGAYEALQKAEGPEVEAEIERVLKGAEDELAREAIVYAVIWKVRKEVVKELGGNNDRKIEEAKYKLRKTRGVEYFELVLPIIHMVDRDKKLLKRLQLAIADKSTRVRRAAITGFTLYPDESHVPLLLENLKKIEKQKAKVYREWVLTRNALEAITGQNFHESVEDWSRWWDIRQGKFSIKERIEEEKAKKDPEATGKTVAVKKDGVEVTLHVKVVGRLEGYPLLVLPWREKEVDYFRPYFHGVEEFCRVYYVRIPQFEDFKGLEREEKSNLVNYPTKALARALEDLLAETGLEKFAILAHGPDACVLALMLLPDKDKTPAQRATHLVLINPRSAGAAYSNSIENVRREGMKTSNRELVKGADSILFMEDGNPKYKASDAAERAGLGRALSNLEFADPTEPEVGNLGYFYDLPGGVQAMNDSKWSAKSILRSKRTELPVLLFMGMKSVWTPVPDMKMVSGSFKNVKVVEMKDSSETPFISETYLFTKSLEGFLPAPKLKVGEKVKKGKEKDRAKTKAVK